MTVPNALYLDCPHCGERTLHEVLRGRMGTKGVLEATVRCQECEHVHSTVVREQQPKEISIIISDHDVSERRTLELVPQETVAVDEEIFVDDVHVRITAIEVDQNRRVQKASVEDITTLWARRFDRLKVKVSINSVHRTFARTIEATPDEEFYIGDVIEVGQDEAAIHSIKVKRRMIRNRGSAEARDIIRIYAKLMRKTYI